MSYKTDLPANFPKAFLDSSKSLEHLGVSEIAWNWQYAIKVVDFLHEYNYMILGGDVFRVIHGKLNFTYDNWYVNKDIKKSRDKMLTESKNKAISYITQYHERNGEDYYYSIEFDKV